MASFVSSFYNEYYFNVISDNNDLMKKKITLNFLFHVIIVKNFWFRFSQKLRLIIF